MKGKPKMEDHQMAKKEEAVTVDSALSKEDINILFWESVCETNPNYTSEFRNAWGGTSTTIAAQWQIREATKKWGRLGDGWGTKVEIVQIHPDLVALEVSIWNTDNTKGEKRYGNPLIGTSPLHIKRKMRNTEGEYVLDSDKCHVMNRIIDDNAPFKAFTNGLTKGLSHFGFSADIFLGKFDDNKYVTELIKKFDDKIELSVEARKIYYDKIMGALNKDGDLAESIFSHWNKATIQEFKDEELLTTLTNIETKRPELLGDK